ncbi:hypothetical protein RRG08_006130 [Elysia crispata]|uniref:Uncharacterized protein n=1 Tax=Elysia crispata TaxID=231223 RepID=A0AAE0ZHS2_9GAST|nr:hypothetical protein RRG08_006130 [Elysia crispata]
MFQKTRDIKKAKFFKCSSPMTLRVMPGSAYSGSSRVFKQLKLTPHKDSVINLFHSICVMPFNFSRSQSKRPTLPADVTHQTRPLGALGQYKRDPDQLSEVGR